MSGLARAGVHHIRLGAIVVIASVPFSAVACGGSEPKPAADGATTSAAPASSPMLNSTAFSGTYHLKYPGNEQYPPDESVYTWTVTPCGSQCVGIVQQSSSVEGQAHLVDNTWTLKVFREDALICDDGSVVPGTTVWTWDAATLVGTQGNDGPTHCPGDTARSNYDEPFNLTKVS